MAGGTIRFCLFCGISLGKWVRKFCSPECNFFWFTRVHATGCWEWTGPADPSGYGRIGSHFHRKFGIDRYAHRYGYTLLIGKIPGGLQLDHQKCRWKGCVNPFHLVPCTLAENAAQPDGAVGIQLARTHCKMGHHYADENLRINRKGHRVCVACERARWRRKIDQTVTKLYCKYEHPLFGPNMRLYTLRGHKQRICRTCQREKMRGYRANARRLVSDVDVRKLHISFE